MNNATPFLRYLVVLGAAVVGLAACGGGDDASAPSASVAPVAPLAPPLMALPADLFTRSSTPITVTRTLDETRAATSTIGRAGGSVSATGADGTRFTFVVPPNALPEDTPITVTPIVSTTGAPWTRAVGANFAPAGLQFYRYATLQIEPPAGFVVPIAEQVTMGGTEDGDLFFAIPDPGTAPRIKVLHFSDYWFGAMNREQIEAARLRLPRLAEVQIEHQISAMLGADRQCQLLGGNDCNSFIDALGIPPGGTWFDSPLVKQYIAAKLEPAIRNAAFCVDYKQVISISLGLERQRQLLGLGGQGDDFLSTLTTLAHLGPSVAALVSQTVPFGDVSKAAAYTCARDASNRCARFGHFTLIQEALGVERQSQLLGGEGLLGTPFERTYLKYGERIDACYRYNVEFDSTLTVAAIPGAVSAVSTVRSRITDYTLGLGNSIGSTIPGLSPDAARDNAPLQNTAFDVTPPACGSAGNVARGGASFKAALRFDPGVSGRPSTAELTLFLGNTAESWTVTGCGVGTVLYGPGPVWTDQFLQAHAGNAFRQEGISQGVKLSFTQPDLPLNGPTLLSKTYARTVGNVEENTTIKVVHAPQPFTEPVLPPAQQPLRGSI